MPAPRRKSTASNPVAQFEPNYSTFKPKHLQLFELANHPDVDMLMAAGGIRSGKSVALATTCINRAMSAPGSRHGIFHAFGNVVDRNLFELTFPQTFEILMPGYWQQELVNKQMINSTDRVITMPNGSLLMFFGLDNPDKMRGQEFATIWVNEANRDIDYDTITTLEGRLSQTVYKQALPGEEAELLQHKFFVDLNPQVKSSWEYQVFQEKVVPGDRSPLFEPWRYQWVHINPADNESNLPPGYLQKRFAGMTIEKRKRDELGLWADDNPNALFGNAKIGRLYKDPAELLEIVVSIDPAGTATNKSDQTGLIVAGKDAEGRFYVLEDASMRAKPSIWIKHAEDLRRKYDANWIISENDYAKDILEDLIARVIPGAPIKYVSARGRGKRLRAEPFVAMYEQGLVNHPPVMIERNGLMYPDVSKPNPLRELEQQLVEFDSPYFKGSPDRVDALVYALQHLSSINQRTPTFTIVADNYLA